MGIGTGMGMVDRKWQENRNISLEEIPISRVNHIFGIIFFNGLLTCLTCIAYYYFTNLAVNCFWCLHGFSGVDREGMGRSSRI